MALSVQLVFLSSLAAFCSADVAASLALYQNTAEGAFNALQNEVNIQRQIYNQAIAKLSADVNEAVDVKVRQTEERVQKDCNRQLHELNRQLQELTNRTNTEKIRLQNELQAQAFNFDQRMNELNKNHQIELVRVRSELSAANALVLNNLRRELEGQVSVAQGEVLRIQTENESSLRNLQKELEETRKAGEIRFRNAQQEIEQQNRKIQQFL
ncbi:hypothetical protein Bhyg_15098 [Pseudolycoriella hygida]|uniref:Uncharacterized protein n=1 Tax=Pseudolycoriella hygida TaxID=35572 RepID=A0A9Q0RY46_9DIPT|nr:hypothetical protein Bhyg_15098 [Pseudolycoriella hygida]